LCSVCVRAVCSFLLIKMIQYASHRGLSTCVLPDQLGSKQTLTTASFMSGMHTTTC